MTFTGFCSEGIALLGRIPAMSRSEFQDEKARYRDQLAEPAKGFVAAMLSELRSSVFPAIEGIPRTNGSIAPINNDLRFSPDKPPYKDHLLFRFWEGTPKKTAPTLFVRIAPGTVGFATGVVFADVAKWRARVDSSGGEIVSAIDALATFRSVETVGETLKRTPQPYAGDHPQAALLRHKMLQVRWTSEDIDPTANDLTERAVAELVNAQRIHEWLVRNLR